VFLIVGTGRNDLLGRESEARGASPCVLMKYDIVIGIIGNTQGVKIASTPKPSATMANRNNPSSPGRPLRLRDSFPAWASPVWAAPVVPAAPSWAAAPPAALVSTAASAAGVTSE
jgi:hypothetical protein